MRDPNRIPEMLQNLQRLWEMCPDLRLGQLISNCQHYGNQNTDVFNIEDDDLMVGLAKLLQYQKDRHAKQDSP